MNTTDIVEKLWNLCHVLRDDDITYHKYVTELTYLIFLKMAEETGAEGQLPEEWRWKDLCSEEGVDQLNFCRQQLIHLGSDGSERVKAIYANAQTAFRHPRNLAKVVQNIDALDWYSAWEEVIGDFYEVLLEKNANEKKSGVGPYFTLRPLIDCMVHLMQPRTGETTSDPAAETFGFVIAVAAHIKARTNEPFDFSEAKRTFQKSKAYYGVELVPLALINATLHVIESDIILRDPVSSTGQELQKNDVIIINPPFGTKKGGGLSTRDDFAFPTSNNKQLAFLQHIYRTAKKEISSEPWKEGHAVPHNEPSQPKTHLDPEFTPKTPFLEMDEIDHAGTVWNILFGQGSLRREEAIKTTADESKERGLAQFKRLRKDGTRWSAINKAIQYGIRIDNFDKPKRGFVRAVLRNAADYEAKDWEWVVQAIVGDASMDEEEVTLAAAEWAKENMGLEFERLQRVGVIYRNIR